MSNERRPGIRAGMPTAARSFLRTAGIDIPDEEYAEFEAMSDSEIDEAIKVAKAEVDGIEWRKKMRRTASESRALRVFETNDAEKELTLDKTAKITIDRVPPKVRKDMQGGN